MSAPMDVRLRQANEIIRSFSHYDILLYAMAEPLRKNQPPLRMLINRAAYGCACIDVPAKFNWGNGQLALSKNQNARLPFGSTQQGVIAQLVRWVLYTTEDSNPQNPYWRPDRSWWAARAEAPLKLYGPETLALIDKYIFGVSE